jgi:hypothetical protein
VDLHVCQVLERTERRPARRQQARAQLLVRQIVQLASITGRKWSR